MLESERPACSSNVLGAEFSPKSAGILSSKLKGLAEILIWDFDSYTLFFYYISCIYALVLKSHNSVILNVNAS